MSIYTKKGDNGITSLQDSNHVSKSDDRIQLLGNFDELTSNLGLIKASYPKKDIKLHIQHIQENIKTIMAGVADQYNRNYKIREDEVAFLEEEINKLEQLFPELNSFIIPGGNTLSAQIDISRTVARRTERWMTAVAKKYSVDAVARKYINRLSDYLFTLARYTDYLFDGGKSNSNQAKEQSENIKGGQIMLEQNNEVLNKDLPSKGVSKDDLVNAVISKLGIGCNRISLEAAKRLIEMVENYSREQGLNAVIAICGPDGNPIAIHVMDGAFLASFDIAMKKAYTSVAVKMSTKELGKLAMPGETFYGIDKADNGRMMIIGGGVPLKVGDRIIGGLGVSGGTAEEDSKIAEYGLQVLEDVLESR